MFETPLADLAKPRAPEGAVVDIEDCLCSSRR